MTQQLHFHITINAPRHIVWNVMLAPDTYRDWTTAFCEGSYYEGSWEQGSRIRFLSPDGDGMSAEIAESRPHEFISIRHLGYINKGVEDTTSDAIRQWAPAFENYRFTDNGNGTNLQVEQDVTAEFEAYMKEAWPRALQRLKALCEQQ